VKDGVKFWILGSRGMLGRSLTALCRERKYATVELSRGDFDYERPDLSVLTFGAGDVVLNAAAYTAVDLAESEPDRAELVNAIAPGQVAQIAHRAGARFVQVSTDYVFDGKAKAPYEPSATVAPQSVYGRSKALGEGLIQEAHPKALIVRTSWVFAPWGKNFVLTMAELLKTRAQVNVVADQFGCPTYAPDLGRALVDLALSGATGIYHFANGPAVSWYEFARAIQDAQGSTADIVPVPSSQFPRPANRPEYSVLSVEATGRLVSRAPDFRDRLGECLTPQRSEKH
jgi:dTDP-4-dehydrorhamnose reductase